MYQMLCVLVATIAYGTAAGHCQGSQAGMTAVTFQSSTYKGKCSNVEVMSAQAIAPSKAERRAEAKAKGYEGEMCSECGNFTLVRNGTCMKCDTCGSTTGCS
jgi:hypothetical protein